MIFFTADQHYNHANSIKYCNRPFKDVEEMNEEMIKRHNSVVKELDVVYSIGDMCFGNILPILNRLNGIHKLVYGSHDRRGTLPWHTDRFEVLGTTHELKHDGKIIFLNHYAQRVWPKSHYGAWHLYGHSHGNLPGLGYSFDVGVDTNNFYPYSFDQIKERMEKIVVTEYRIFDSKGDYCSDGKHGGTQDI